MGKRFENTKTSANLLTAFAGESMARNKYTFFASAARKEGYEEIARIFEETAANEKEHAEIWFKLMEQLGSTEFNLKSASEGEHYEWSDMYKTFAQDARDENFHDVAALFENTAKVEKLHEDRFNECLKKVQDKTVFTSRETVKWKCLNCGFELEGKEPPEVCPLCAHPKAYFKNENCSQ